MTFWNAISNWEASTQCQASLQIPNTSSMQCVASPTPTWDEDPNIFSNQLYLCIFGWEWHQELYYLFTQYLEISFHISDGISEAKYSTNFGGAATGCRFNFSPNRWQLGELSTKIPMICLLSSPFMINASDSDVFSISGTSMLFIFKNK